MGRQLSLLVVRRWIGGVVRLLGFIHVVTLGAVFGSRLAVGAAAAGGKGEGEQGEE